MSILFALFAFACGQAESTPTAQPPPTDVPARPFSSPVPLNASSFVGRDDFANLLEGLGPEREFPQELLNNSHPLSKGEAATIWTQYLTETRVFQMKDTVVVKADDFCANGTGKILYQPFGKDGDWYVGANKRWTVAFDEFTKWNEPRLVDPNTHREFSTFILQGLNAVPGASLVPPEDGGVPQSDQEGFNDLRVFENPSCESLVAMEDVAQGQWNILAVDSAKPLPWPLAPGQPQLHPDIVTSLWDEYFGGLLVFDRLNGGPSAVYCSDHTGVYVGRYDPPDEVGKPFTWSITDASDTATNAAWFRSSLRSQDPDLLDPAILDDPSNPLSAQEISGCSVQAGLDYLETLDLPKRPE